MHHQSRFASLVGVRRTGSRRKRTEPRLGWVALFVATVALGMASTARADVVNVCAQKSTGLLRIISEAESCKSNEDAVTLGQHGIYGDGSAGEVLFDVPGPPFNDENTQYTDFIVEEGVTLHVPSGLVIRCTGSFVNRGIIEVSDSSNGGYQGLVGAGALGGRRPPGQGVARGVAMTGDLGDSSATRVGGSGGTGLGLEQAARQLLHPGHQGGGGGAGRANAFSVTAGRGGGTLTVIAKEGISNEGLIRALPGLAGEGGGGGGGGIVILASRTKVMHTGQIVVPGGKGGRSDATGGGGGGGGGGLVHFLAPVVEVTGNVDVSGGEGGTVGPAGSVTAAWRQGGGGGGGSGRSGGIGGAVSPSGDPGTPSDGSDGHVLVTEVDPSSLF